MERVAREKNVAIYLAFLASTKVVFEVRRRAPESPVHKYTEWHFPLGEMKKKYARDWLQRYKKGA